MMMMKKKKSYNDVNSRCELYGIFVTEVVLLVSSTSSSSTFDSKNSLSWSVKRELQNGKTGNGMMLANT